ncbi:hypothetical protein [Anaerobiospirillum succiniciproducens]|uniref:hypothetical protein n=1 Tax=Anaerobiospirillum succiniciproducens TaxID=13335 RepID=UPI00248D5F8F|nr:hypothetical protein [Anaerobiospirillum succiniciproducens]
MTQSFNIPSFQAPAAQAPAANAALNPALSGVAPAYAEEIQKCVANGKLSLSIEGVYSLVKDKIATTRNQAVQPIDVVTVIKTAVSAGLDPTSDDVFAFKSSDRVIVGISKKGWSKVLDSRRASISFNYGPLLPAQVGQKSHYEWVSAEITKSDGSKIEGPRVYNDEFDRKRDVWASNPKAMLVARAFTHACAMAFGIGAYDEEEARSIFYENSAQPRQMAPQAPAMPALPQVPQAPASDNPFAGCSNIKELNETFNSLPKTVKGGALIQNLYKQAKDRLSATEATLEANEVTELND